MKKDMNKDGMDRIMNMKDTHERIITKLIRIIDQ